MAVVERRSDLIVLLVHGFNVEDPERTIGGLGKHLRDRGHEVHKFCYGHAGFMDVRFANEADMLRAYKGVILRIDRPGLDKPADIAAHPSENMDFAADVTLVNDGTPEDLHAMLAEIWPPTIVKKA